MPPDSPSSFFISKLRVREVAAVGSAWASQADPGCLYQLAQIIKDCVRAIWESTIEPAASCESELIADSAA